MKKDYLVVEQDKSSMNLLVSNGLSYVDLSIFDVVDNLFLCSKIKNEIDITNTLYNNLLYTINSLHPDICNAFYKTLNEEEKINNQILSGEDKFSMLLFNNYYGTTALDEMLKSTNGHITRKYFMNMHDLLLKGTSSDNKLGLRENNLRFLNSINNIAYAPLLVSDIDKAVDKFITKFNIDLQNNNDYDMYLKPIIYHGLISVMQLFKSGNTRYGKLFEHIMLWKRNNLNNNYSDNPIVYATKEYSDTNDKYLSLIEDIAIKNDVESWNNWIIYNLKQLQSNIISNHNKLIKCKEYSKR